MYNNYCCALIPKTVDRVKCTSYSSIKTIYYFNKMTSIITIVLILSK